MSLRRALSKLRKLFRREKSSFSPLQKVLLGALRDGMALARKDIAEQGMKHVPKILNTANEYCADKLDLHELRRLLVVGKQGRVPLEKFAERFDECAREWRSVAAKRKSAERKKPLIAMLVPDGQTVRTFMMTDTWGELSKLGDIVILSTLSQLNEHIDDLQPAPMAVLPVPGADRINLDTLVRFAFYRNNQGTTYRIFAENLEHANRERRGETSGRDRNIELWNLSQRFADNQSYEQLLAFSMLAYGALYPVGEAAQLLRELAPDVLLNTTSISPVSKLWTRAAALEGIATASYVISWDNVSTKWSLDEFADLFMVWSQQMADDFAVSFPELSHVPCAVTGTPQFAPIERHKPGSSREQFCKRYGLNPQIPIVLYTTGSKTMFPAEPEFLEWLFERWQSQLADRMQFMVRMHPKDRTGRYDELRQKYPQVPFTLPAKDMNTDEWIPVQEDVRLLTDQLNHCAMVINVASTMTIEGFAADRPSINLGFDMGKVYALHYPLKDYYRSHHYRDIVEEGAISLAQSPEDVVTAIQAYLDDPMLDHAARQIIYTRKSSPPLQAAEHIARALKTLL